MEQVMREAMAEPYDIVFGRKTYETFAGHWTAAPEDDPVSAIMNGSRKYVVTNSLKTLSWAHSKIVSGDAVEAVAALKFEDGPLLQVHGSWDLIQTLLRADLIDEFRIWTFPVVVGPGKRLFEAAPQRTLSLIKSEPCSNGVLMQVFRRDGAI
jgi:dihydrofolate reductase